MCEPLFFTELNPRYFCVVGATVSGVASGAVCGAIGGHIVKPLAVQYDCGHRACQDCVGASRRSVDQEIFTDHTEECPACKEQVEAFPDVAVKRDLKQVRVYCRNKDIGCDIITSLGEHENHMKVCKFNGQAKEGGPPHNDDGPNGSPSTIKKPIRIGIKKHDHQQLKVCNKNNLQYHTFFVSF